MGEPSTFGDDSYGYYNFSAAPPGLAEACAPRTSMYQGEFVSGAPTMLRQDGGFVSSAPTMSRPDGGFASVGAPTAPTNFMQRDGLLSPSPTTSVPRDGLSSPCAPTTSMPREGRASYARTSHSQGPEVRFVSGAPTAQGFGDKFVSGAPAAQGFGTGSRAVLRRLKDSRTGSRAVLRMSMPLVIRAHFRQVIRAHTSHHSSILVLSRMCCLQQCPRLCKLRPRLRKPK